MATVFTKKEAIVKWLGIPAKRRNLANLARAIPNGHTGSTYGSDTIRISGSRAFIEEVLSRIPDMIEAESSATRLALSWSSVEDTNIGGKAKSYSYAGEEVVYIKVHQRGPEAIMVNGIIDAFADRAEQRGVYA